MSSTGARRRFSEHARPLPAGLRGPFPEPIRRLGEMVNAGEVRAVEVYRHIREAPSEIRDGYRRPWIDGRCGIVQI